MEGPQPFELAPDTPANWTSVQEGFFIDKMVELVLGRGNVKSSGVFAKDEWMLIRKNYYERFQIKHSKKSFKNKCQHLKERFKDFKKLVEENTGLGWDPILVTVEATAEWWENYLKINPRSRRFQTKGCPEYKKLEIIFGDTIATGNIQASACHDFNTSGEDDSDDDANETETVPATQPPNNDSQNPIGTDSGEGPSRPRKRTRSSRNSKSGELSEAMKMMAEASQTRNELRKKYTIQDCMEVLDKMEEAITEDTYARAMKLLQEKGWREAFVNMSNERRNGWIRSIERGVL